MDIKNFRGQSYDNAQNMSGIYNGLQAEIKKKSIRAEFVPCSAHSLNLVGTFVAEVKAGAKRGIPPLEFKYRGNYQLYVCSENIKSYLFLIFSAG